LTVLVTGGAGYIGSHAVLALLDAGETPVVIDDLSAGRREAVPHGVPFYRGDAGDAAFVEAILSMHGVSDVMHFAGSIIVPDSVSDPLGYYGNNTVKAHSLLAACMATGVRRFVFSSTAAVYGTPEESPVKEDAPVRPESPYGWSKAMTERMLRDSAAAYGLSFAALRYFNVAGADPAGRAGQSSPRATHLVKVACQAASGIRDGIDVYGTDYPTRDGTALRDYVHVSDLAQAHLLALGRLRDRPEPLVLNLGSGQGFTVLEVIEAVRRVSGAAFRVSTAGRRPGDPAALVADSSKARDLLGWKPRHGDMDTIVSTALAWERASVR